MGFTLKMSLPLLDGANFNIFDTDYSEFSLFLEILINLLLHLIKATYAGVYTCKITADKDFRSVTLWSRTKTLSDATVNSLKAKVKSYGGDPTSLQKMIQSDFIPLSCLAINALSPLLATAAAGITDIATMFN